MSCRHALVGENLLRGISAQLNEIRRVVVFTLRRGGQAADPCGSSQTLHNADHRRRAADPCGTRLRLHPSNVHQRVIHHQLASESSNASQPVTQRQPASQPPASHATAGHVLYVEAVVPLRRWPALVQRAIATTALGVGPAIAVESAGHSAV